MSKSRSTSLTMPPDFLPPPDLPQLERPRPDPAALLAWYDRHRRVLPWRCLPGTRPDPYRIWLSEIMLQQTTVATVGPYFDRFVTRWPDFPSLAAASLDDILHQWQGLGYYARARNLHACAKAVVARHGGTLPDDPAALRALPGIGEYTCGAIAAIAFDRPLAAVDGNVERVMARLYAVETPMPAAKKTLAAQARALVPTRRAGDFAQALMDLGATICTPRQPRCILCPWREECAGSRTGTPEKYPIRALKPERPRRFGVAFWLTRPDGAVLLRRRAETGLLGGMMEFPSTEWRGDPWGIEEAVERAPVPANWTPVAGTVTHVFTHFRLDLAIVSAECSASPAGIWSTPAQFGELALPTLMKKLARHVLSGMPDAP